MKAMYIEPQVEIAKVGLCTVLQTVSGPEGLKDGGQASGGTTPKAPGRVF